MTFRIVEKTFDDGYVKYVLEKLEDGEWNSKFAHSDLEVIREAKRKKERSLEPVATRVIE